MCEEGRHCKNKATLIDELLGKMLTHFVQGPLIFQTNLYQVLAIRWANIMMGWKSLTCHKRTRLKHALRNQFIPPKGTTARTPNV